MPAVAVSLSALFGFGSLTLLLSQKLKNRWGVMALSFAILAAVYFLPLSTESFRTYDEPASAWVNSFCLSPLISTFYLENPQGRIMKALFYNYSTMWLLNCAFTSLIGIVSLSLLKRARRA